MSRFVTEVPLRWTDQDAYRHLNHARIVTLLEQARIELAFVAAGAEGLGELSTGLLVAGLEVEYRRQIPYRPDPLRVTRRSATCAPRRSRSVTRCTRARTGPTRWRCRR